MSKITFLAKIKLFISSHLVPVIATSAILVVGVSAGVVAIVINNQPKQETSSNQENTDLAQNSENEKPKQEDETDNKTEDSNPDTNASAKPNTSQNQNSSSSQTKPVEKPSNSNTNNNSNNSSSSQTPAPSQPTTPTQPAKTEYFYVCKGTIPDPATKAQMLAEFPEAKDYITLTLNGPRKVTSCWDEFKNSSMVDPNYTKYFTWQLIECNSLEEMNSYLN